MVVDNFCYTFFMKRFLFTIIIVFIFLFKTGQSPVYALRLPTETPVPIPSPTETLPTPTSVIQEPTGPRYAACDLCGYCPPNTAPQSWPSCQKCLYPNISSDPTTMESLIIDPETNLPPSPFPGRQHTFLGCLGKGEGGFGEEGAAGSVIQSILNIIFSAAGGIAFLYLIYGSFVVATSQANPEKLNYGKRVVYGAIAGLVFTLASVFIVKFIASGILKIPGFGE
jgi:hypothetical protein